MLKRTIAAIFLALISIPAVLAGGVFYFLIITLLLSIAAWEFGRLFAKVGYHPASPLLVGGVFFILTTRTFFPDLMPAALTISVLLAMTWHLLDYENGRDHAGTDFTITVAGVVYLGWVGSHLIDLRNLENGLWWFFLVMPSVWLADSFAYFVGVRFGRHRMSPRLSPKKSWEGYWGGVFFGTLGALVLAIVFTRLELLTLPWWKGAALGAALSVLTTLGDLGESMLKRQAGVKDSGQIIPGHGGVLDRIDSWLWGAALGYFLITWFLL